MWTSGNPLVHNASMCADLGYYYRANDVEEGARHVLGIIDGFDAQYANYREHQRSLIRRYLPDDPALVAHYAALVENLFTRPAR